MEATGWFSGKTYLTAADFAVLGALMALMVGLGLAFRKKQTDTQEFFLGRRSIPWWAACLSFVATEISAVTIISVPATAYRENWEYLQFFVGSAAARITIAFLFIPAFYRFNCTTIYQFLGGRFGTLSQVAGSVFFFITRLLGSAVRLMAACLAVSVLLGWHIVPAIGLFTGISIIYIALGGIRAGIWASMCQGLTILAGGAASLIFLVTRIDGGWSGLLETAGGAGKLSIINWGPALSDPTFWKTVMGSPNIFWLAALNGLFGSLAAFGTDHDLMQRLLTVETRKQSQKTMLLTIPASLSVLFVYLLIGAGLYAFYAQNPGLAVPAKTDQIFPHFIGSVMPPFLRGLLLSTIVMASIDSPLASLSASFVTDIYRPLIRRAMDERHYLFVSRICVAVFGVILGFLAYGFSHFDKILWLAFKIGGVTFGSLLGVFLLGLLTERKANRANVVAMTASAFLMLTLLILSETGRLALGWTWLVILGTLLTFALGWVLGPALEKRD
jgi:solute:Na+ symporter, SSS family